MAVFRVAGIFVALLAYTTLMSSCKGGYANAGPSLRVTLEIPPEAYGNDLDAKVTRQEFNPQIDGQVDIAQLPGGIETACAESSKNAVVEQSFSGKITSLGHKQFVIKDDKNAEHTFEVNEDTKYTLDGNEAIFSQLKVDNSVTVMAEKDGANFVAKMVDAISSE